MSTPRPKPPAIEAVLGPMPMPPLAVATHQRLVDAGYALTLDEVGCMTWTRTGVCAFVFGAKSACALLGPDGGLLVRCLGAEVGDEVLARVALTDTSALVPPDAVVEREALTAIHAIERILWNVEREDEALDAIKNIVRGFYS